MPLLELTSVSKTFQTAAGLAVDAVADVSLSVEPGETLGLIGESGSGKSTLGRIALGLLSPDSGQVVFNGRDLGQLSPPELRQMRSRLSVVFQEPYEALDPRQRVGATVGEPLLVHARKLSRRDRDRVVRSTLEEVGLPAEYADRFPRELSGGEQQRVGVARAIITRPRLVVLDEPTSSLDLSVRAQVLLLLRELQKNHQLAYLFISHDIHTVEYMSGRIAVMRGGKVVESGDSATVMRHPEHEYTQTLLASALSLEDSNR
jgi:ABC-type microcin C transport system duplicated ATPase subunit YejF